jgi:hypothetical protein
VKAVPVAALALGALVTAAAAGRAARDRRPPEPHDEPYAPSTAAAPIFALGYRELAADLLFVRLKTYVGGPDSQAPGIASLVEAIVALDPSFRRIYEWGGIAMSRIGVTEQQMLFRAIAVLEAGARRYPDDWKLPNIAGQIYISDLVTDDPVQRREWDERGQLLVETASRKPGAPANLAVTASHLQSRLGRHEQARKNLEEIFRITDDEAGRKRILEQIAKLDRLSESEAAEVAAELVLSRQQFDARWQRDRPAIPASFYILLGPHLPPGFDPADLATGGRDVAGSVVGEDVIEKLEPLYEEGATSPTLEGAPSSP